jgi:hypothetical protein
MAQFTPEPSLSEEIVRGVNENSAKVTCDTPKDQYPRAGMSEAWFDVLIDR